MVVPNLMEGFQLDKVQAEYVADIRLRNINKEYILKRTAETEQLEKDIADLADLIAKPTRIQKEIIRQLEAVKKAHGQDRRTEILLQDQLAEEVPEEEDVPSYPVHLFLSREGYFKDHPPVPADVGGAEIQGGGTPGLPLGDHQRCGAFFSPTGSSATRPSPMPLTTARPASWGLSPRQAGDGGGETILWAGLAGDYTGQLLFFFANGKVARVPPGQLPDGDPPEEAHGGLL